MSGRGHKPQDPFLRLWSKIIPGQNGCWNWVGTTRGHMRYGVISVNGKSVSTHRLAWSLSKGNVPKDLCVLHRCDNPACVNPDHLFLGTPAENNADMMFKGRNVPLGGELSPHRKLSWKSVNKIITLRKSGMTLKQVASRFGVHFGTIWKIENQKTWKSL